MRRNSQLGGQSETVFSVLGGRRHSGGHVRNQGPRVSFAKLLCDLGNGVDDDGIGAGIKLPEDQGVGECVGEALVVDQWTEDSEGSGSFVLVVEYGIGEELFKSSDVLVRDVVVETSVVNLS